jgi:hypothetical protein
MITKNYLLKKYSTGAVYTSPATIDYFDNKLRSFYWCSGKISDILEDYNSLLLYPPTKRCKLLKKVDDDGVLRSEENITSEELDWLWMEYKLRNAIITAVGPRNIYFVIQE